MSKRYIATLDIVVADKEATKEAEKELAARLAQEGLTKGLSYWVIETDLKENELVEHLQAVVLSKLKLSTERSISVKSYRNL